MRKLISIIILFLFIVGDAQAQGPYWIYLPMIFKLPTQAIDHEVWKVISPVGSTNYVLNPSAETTGNYSALGSATITRSTTKQLYGLYSYSIATGKNADGINFTLSTLTNSVHTVSFRVSGRLPNNLRCILGSSIKEPLFVEQINPDWALYACTFSKESSNSQTSMRIIQQGNGLGSFYLDGVQVEPYDYWTTYIDGDQDGCYWNGTEHAASSTRSAKSYDGGQVKDLYKDYGFFVTDNVGAGLPPRQNNIDDYAIVPGGALNSIKINVRDFSLVGRFQATSEAELENYRNSFDQLIRGRGTQPLKWLVYHPSQIKEIKASYNGGLEGSAPVYYEEVWSIEDNDKWVQNLEFTESATIALKAADPYFYGIGDKVAVLDTLDSATFRAVAARLKSIEQWSNLGPPGAGGTYTAIWDMVEDDNYVYIAGDFQNFDGIANADYIVQYDKKAGTYSALSTGTNNIVYALAISSTGVLYLGGDFTSAGGVANTNRIASWNGSTFSPLGTGANAGVFALVFGLDGTLYLGGNFTTLSGNVIVRQASWNGSTFSAMGTGATGGAVQALTVGLDGTIFIGGQFTSNGGVSNTRGIASWNGSAISALSTGMDNDVWSLAVGPDGTLYVGGNFTTAGGVSATRLASWNGSIFAALGSGANGIVYELKVAPDGTLYASGAFTSAGGVSLRDRIAKWNGYAFSHVDIDLPGSAIAAGMLVSKLSDPVIPQKYDLYLGFTTTGTGYFAGKITATNNGNSDTFPKVIFERSGGTAVTVETLKNESTGKELLLNYGLLDGERLTIDLKPSNQSIISSYFGSVPSAVLANSNLDWTLEPGDNDITSFVANTNIALYPSEVTAWMQWRETFESFN